MPNNANQFEYARIGPVHFQPLENELQALNGYLLGRLLNAGCGNRNIDSTLVELGAKSVVNFDLESEIPGAVLGSLTKLPFDTGYFDTVLSNAVLEHVPTIDRVMSELVRVLNPGGFLIVAIPFLQPFHADPWDYRRYTQVGLLELADLHDLEVVNILPVHTIAQTLGWIAWEWAQEKGGWRPAVCYPIIWLATRLFNRTDTKLFKNANTYQAIYRKPMKPDVKKE